MLTFPEPKQRVKKWLFNVYEYMFYKFVWTVTYTILIPNMDTTHWSIHKFSVTLFGDNYALVFLLFFFVCFGHKRSLLDLMNDKVFLVSWEVTWLPQISKIIFKSSHPLCVFERNSIPAGFMMDNFGFLCLLFAPSKHGFGLQLAGYGLPLMTNASEWHK